MEHCNGKELLEKFREMRDLTEEKIGCIMKQLLLTVAYIHSRRIVHRNINLEHILLDHSDEMLQIKLLGFSNAAFHAGTKLSGKFGTSYYMAPEVFNGTYNEKCDEWSCGMIMYILLTGITPYPNKSVQEISDEMKMSPFQPQIGDLRGISPKAVMLLQQLLQVDPISRISAYTALTHPWIQQIQSYNTDNSEVLGRLQNLQRNSGFTQVAGTLVSQTLSSEDEKQIIKAFNTFDINNDGYISKQELMEAFALKRHNKNVKFDVNRIIEATHGMSDHISYSEFLQLCISQASYTSKENLAEIFGKLDSNKHGKINQNDIKNLLNYNNKVSDDVWAQMLKEADTNKDGFVDFDEFVSSMNRNV